MSDEEINIAIAEEMGVEDREAGVAFVSLK